MSCINDLHICFCISLNVYLCMYMHIDQFIKVNELFIGDHQKIRKTCEQLGLHRAGGFQQHKCYSELLH